MYSMNQEDLEVDFEKYCPKCEYRDYPEESDICTECLAYPMNHESHKPHRFKQSDEPKKYEPVRSKADEKYLRAIQNNFDI